MRKKTQKARPNEHGSGPKTNCAEMLTDSLGEPVPPGLASIFAKAKEFKDKTHQLNALNRWIEKTKEHPAGAFLKPSAA